MPRLARIVLPGYPHHIVQRGHNRQVVFAQEEDDVAYPANLQELKPTFGIGIYASGLVTHPVHLHLHLQQSGEAVAHLKIGSGPEAGGA